MGAERGSAAPLHLGHLGSLGLHRADRARRPELDGRGLTDGVPLVSVPAALARADGASAAWTWLRLDCDAAPLAERWIRLTYRAGLLDPVVRPVLRCVGAGTPDQVLHAAPFGRATWLGRIPAGTTDLWLSPGTPAFAVERVARVSGRALGWALLRRSRVRWFNWMAAPLVGLHGASAVQVRRELTATPLDRYDAWRRAGTRVFDPAFDGRPGGDGSPHVRVVVMGRVDRIAPLLVALRAQRDPNWSLAVLGGGGESHAGGDRRVMMVVADAPLAAAVAGLADEDLIFPVQGDDAVPDHATAVLARAARDDPAAIGFTADLDGLDGAGRFRAPVFHAGADALVLARDTGRDVACAIRVGYLRAAELSRAADLLPPRLTAALGPAAGLVRPIRRVLLTRSAGSAPPPFIGAPAPPKPIRSTAARGADFRATIVIPTKDRLDLLGRCIDSLQRTGSLEGAEVVVVDNASTQPDTKAYLADLTRDARFRVLADDRPFNFSRLCNGGAAMARAPLLVFLNNDTEALDSAWLDALADWAGRPEVGAAGAKLLYPDRTVQHAGVVIGIDGLAGHFERGIGRDDPGVFGRLCTPHAVSAVTAACLAVERWKFDAVGGFDADTLPVDLNDVDLCLRLGARGWTSVLVPDAVLIHHESASRGVSRDPDTLYRAEQASFRARWMAAIRDDPHFHPALSLDALEPRLG